jgi:hypothetical protein
MRYDDDPVQFYLNKLPREFSVKKQNFPEQEELNEETDRKLQKIGEIENESDHSSLDQSQNHLWEKLLYTEMSKHIKTESLENPDSMTRIERKLADEITVEVEAARKKFEKLVRKRSTINPHND